MADQTAVNKVVEALTYGGVPKRAPTASEMAFFSRSGVPGYAAPDGAVVMNPQSTLSPAERGAVEKNEAARQWMQRTGMQPSFALTPEQQAMLSGNAYAGASREQQRATIAARLLSGDPSAGAPTQEQAGFVNRLRYGMGIR